MQAIVLRSSGGPEQLRLEEVPTPDPGYREVLVALRYAALNRRDLLVRTRPGYQESMPFIPGSDGAGEIAATGPGVRGFQVGDRAVIYPALNWGIHESHPSEAFEILGGPTDGTYAQYVRLPEENVFPIPPGLSTQQAAALPVAGLTAWRALISKARLQPGERVFIPGIGSGAALFATQIARLAGGRIFVTSHSDEKIRRALEIGAEAGANYTDPGWVEEIRKRSGGGVEVVIDSVGSATFSTGLDLLRPGGRLVTFGSTSGASISLEVRQLYSRQITIFGTTMGSPREFEAFQAAFASAGLLPVIDRSYSLKDAAEAHRRMESKEQFGKILLEAEG
jgi:NADPH:quinone reductase-like Zn-dependent oxidoreductase